MKDMEPAALPICKKCGQLVGRDHDHQDIEALAAECTVAADALLMEMALRGANGKLDRAIAGLNAIEALMVSAERSGKVETAVVRKWIDYARGKGK